MAEQGDDPVVRGFRDRIDETDREILALVNQRVGLVAELHDHKRAHGYASVDAGREQAVLDELADRNTGPLSSDGLRELFRTLIEITKREVGRQRTRAG